MTVVHRVRGDGNCLFRALAYPRGDHRTVRACVVRHMRARWKQFEPFVPEDVRDVYLAEMARDGVWGDHLVIEAFCDAASSVYELLSRNFLTAYGTYAFPGMILQGVLKGLELRKLSSPQPKHMRQILLILLTP